jgi:hypothetical protein
MTHESRQLALVPVAAMTATTRIAERIAVPVGPGWFDSSWDLQCGLEVREEDGAEADLRAWIDEFVRSQRTTGRIASPRASTAIA